MRGKSEKMKMKFIIKTYILLQQGATAYELANFLNNNFRWNGTITARNVAGICKDTQKNSILEGLQKSLIQTEHGKVYQYFFGDNDE